MSVIQVSPYKYELDLLSLEFMESHSWYSLCLGFSHSVQWFWNHSLVPIVIIFHCLAISQFVYSPVDSLFRAAMLNNGMWSIYYKIYLRV